MSRSGRSFLVAVLATVLVLPAHGAMFKWVDEKGNTHYGDRVPPQYADRATDQMKKSGRPGKPDPKAADSRPAQQDPEKQRMEARQQQERQRQDVALLATYANEAEIEQARERELRRNSDVLKHSTAGLAKSNAKEDRQRLDQLIEQSRQENDAINARYDGQKARFRELTAPRSSTQTAQTAPAK